MKVTFKRVYYVSATPFVWLLLMALLNAMGYLRNLDGLSALLIALMAFGLSVVIVRRLEPIVLRPEDRR